MGSVKEFYEEIMTRVFDNFVMANNYNELPVEEQVKKFEESFGLNTSDADFEGILQKYFELKSNEEKLNNELKKYIEQYKNGRETLGKDVESHQEN